jgi:hypothetical protein
MMAGCTAGFTALLIAIAPLENEKAPRMAPLQAQRLGKLPIGAITPLAELTARPNQSTVDIL